MIYSISPIYRIFISLFKDCLAFFVSQRLSQMLRFSQHGIIDYFMNNHVSLLSDTKFWEQIFYVLVKHLDYQGDL